MTNMVNMVPLRELEYDILVMALGSTSNDFGTPGVKEHCIFLDNPHQVPFSRRNAKSVFTLLSS